ncbi:MAG: peptidoglycan bridge formation glycyltransferase FemA/FemB family protein [bacterium]|nr:peptidoglycan bridge formation glycyltransferase FemA/FemB family protein [bacterium]
MIESHRAPSATPDEPVEGAPISLQPLRSDAWLKLAPRFLDDNYRASWAFAQACAVRTGSQSEHVGIRKADDWIGVTDVRVKTLPQGIGGIAYINGGPLVRTGSESDIDRLDECLGALVREYVEQRGLILRILAPIGDAPWNESALDTFKLRGFLPTNRSRAYRTIVLDITGSTDEIRKAFHQKWRNCLNKSERQGLEVQGGDDPELLDQFCELFHGFIERKRFSVDLDAGFYAAVQRSQLDGERYYTSIARQEGRVVAGHVSSMLGDTCVYLLGATHPEALKTNAAYLLQWHTIETARAHGLRRYDLGGIDPEGNPGVYRFKQRMNGEELWAPGPFEMKPAGLRGLITSSAEAAYRMLQRLGSGVSS